MSLLQLSTPPVRLPRRPGGRSVTAEGRVAMPWGTLARVERGPDGADAPRSAESLLSDVAQGDDSAFAALYDTLGRGVFGTCLGVLRDPDHAAEVAQEVWVEVWRTAARFDAARGSARTWALTLAHRRAVDRVRSVQAQRVRDQRVLDQSAEREFDVVADEVESALEQVRVRDCLGSLTPTQKQAVVLAYYGGRTYREVADELAAPLPTVKSRIRDGLLRLRDCLGVTA